MDCSCLPPFSMERDKNPVAPGKWSSRNPPPRQVPRYLVGRTNLTRDLRPILSCQRSKAGICSLRTSDHRLSPQGVAASGFVIYGMPSRMGGFEFSGVSCPNCRDKSWNPFELFLKAAHESAVGKETLVGLGSQPLGPIQVSLKLSHR